MNATHMVDTQQFDAAELGAMMREMRENLGHDLAQVAEDLRIRLVYLEAIEAGRLSDLPGNAYVAGFLRAYSDYLGLDGDEIVRRFRMAGVDMSNQTQLHLPSPVEEGRLPTGPILLVAALVAALAYGGWYYLSSRHDKSVDQVAKLPSELSQMIKREAASTGNASAVAAPSAALQAPVTPDSVLSSPPSSATAAPSAASGKPAATETASNATPAPAAQVSAPPTAADEKVPSPAKSAEKAAAKTETNTGTKTVAALEKAAETPKPEQQAAPERDAVPAAPPSVPSADEGKPPPARASETGSREKVASVAPPAAEPTSAETPAKAVVPTGAASGEKAVAKPAEKTVAKATATAGAPRIVIRAKTDSFVAILTGDHQTLFSQLMHAGDSYEVPSGANLVLETGNAGGLEITVGGRKAPSLGPPGEVRRDIPLEAASLLKGGQ